MIILLNSQPSLLPTFIYLILISVRLSEFADIAVALIFYIRSEAGIIADNQDPVNQWES